MDPITATLLKAGIFGWAGLMALALSQEANGALIAVSVGLFIAFVSMVGRLARMLMRSTYVLARAGMRRRLERAGLSEEEIDDILRD